MMDQILAGFEADERLGMVFPDDPHLVGWTENRPAAALLSARLGLADPPPEAIGVSCWQYVLGPV